MAAILLSACTVTEIGNSQGVKWVKIVTPATADDGDTIDVSSLFHTWVGGQAYGASDGNLAISGSPTGRSITLPGSTDNEARTCFVYGQ